MYRLVIIDDERKILDGIAEIFPWDNIGFQVTGKYTRAKEALKHLEREKVDVVMTDICMPDMNGLELAKELKGHPDILIVIFSSYSDYKYMREALNQIYAISDHTESNEFNCPKKQIEKEKL